MKLITICTAGFFILSLCISVAKAKAGNGETPWPPPPTNQRPVIGVLAQEVNPKTRHFHGDTYFMTSYVKYLEMAGAQVVPIRVGENMTYYTTLVNNINGVLLPGGTVSLSTSLYAKAANILFTLALKANTRNDYFPIWGTCLGSEVLLRIVAEENPTSPCDAENYLLPLNLSKDAKSSKLLKDIPADVLNIATSYNVTPNFHKRCMTPKAFAANLQLSQFYNIISTNVDRKGLEFVSMFEAKMFPIYGSQWHPEKISFIWDVSKNINHSLGAVQVEQYFADFFVNEARRSMHRYPNLTSEAAALIQNYQPIFSGAPSFSQDYYFNLTRPKSKTGQNLLCSFAQGITRMVCRN